MAAVVILMMSSSVLAKDDFSLMIEGKLGNAVKSGDLLGGFGMMLDYPILGERGKFGFEAGVIIQANWADTLDLYTSPDPQDTNRYDIWTRNGTDLNFYLGPEFRYNVSLSELHSISFVLGAGTVVNISAYDEVKKSFTPPPLVARSETPTELEFYMKPKIMFHTKRLYLGYEFFSVSENVEHIVCLGITI